MTMERCAYWREVIGAEMDAGFDAGEFSGPDHGKALETLEPCGRCPDCITSVAAAAEGPSGLND